MIFKWTENGHVIKPIINKQKSYIFIKCFETYRRKEFSFSIIRIFTQYIVGIMNKSKDFNKLYFDSFDFIRTALLK